MWARLASAAPALLAGLAGVGLYYLGGEWLLLAIAAGVAVFAFGFALLWIGRRRLRQHPVSGVWLMNGWILGLVAIGAGVAAGLIVAGIEITEALSKSDETEATEVGALLTGAVATFAGSLFTTDLEEGTGDFWPAAKVKAALQEKFVNVFANDTPGFEAVYEDHTQAGTDGWGLVARHERAATIAAALQQ